MGRQRNVAAAASAIVISFTYSDPRFEREFKYSLKGCREALAELLTAAGCTGQYGVRVSSRAKGTTHLKGLTIGMPLNSYRQVELFWLEGSNDERFVVHLGTNGKDQYVFRQTLVDAQMRLREKTTAIAAPKSAAIVVNHPAKNREVSDDERLSQAMHKLCPLAPSFGFMGRDECLETLAEFGNADELFELLVAGEHLVALPDSDSLFRLGDRWQAKSPAPQTADEAADTPAPAPLPKPADTEQVSKPEIDLLSGLKEAKQVVALAQQAQLRLQAIEQEKDEIAELVRTKTERLAALHAEREQVIELMTNPALKKAEELIREAMAVLNTTST